MAIAIRQAISLLSDILSGDFPEKHFQLKNVAHVAFSMRKENFNRKLNRPFTLTDHMKLVHYFDLPEEAYKAFQAEDEDAFITFLRNLNVGIYSIDHADIISKHLYRLANNSTSQLTFIPRHDLSQYRGGPIGPDNRVEHADETVILTGDAGCVEYVLPKNYQCNGWFSLLNVHVVTGSIRLINPVFKESVIRIKDGWLRYPESDTLNFENSDQLGAHRMFALTVDNTLKETIQMQASRLLRLHNTSDSRDAVNRFDGLLDSTALKFLEKDTKKGVLDVAILPYRQSVPCHSS